MRSGQVRSARVITLGHHSDPCDERLVASQILYHRCCLNMDDRRFLSCPSFLPSSLPYVEGWRERRREGGRERHGGGNPVIPPPPLPLPSSPPPLLLLLGGEIDLIISLSLSFFHFLFFIHFHVLVVFFLLFCSPLLSMFSFSLFLSLFATTSPVFLLCFLFQFLFSLIFFCFSYFVDVDFYFFGVWV